jgi:phage major head subunit gpT-like protein
MNITANALNGIYTAYYLRYQTAFGAAKPFYIRIATLAPSTSRSNTYGWMDRIPKMREWVGDRVVQNASARAYVIVNKPFELTLELDRDDIEDDQVGLYTPTVDMIGEQAALYPDDLVADLMRKGDTTTAHDDQYFFDTDHPINPDDAASGVQSNLFTGRALNQANFAQVRAAMMSWKGADGRVLNVMPDLLVVPPALENIARTILEAELINRGGVQETNVYKGVAEVLVVPQLADGGVGDTEWYLLDTTKPIKPFVFQNRKSPRFQTFFDDKDENVFMRRKYKYGVDARGNAGYGLWFLAAKARA